MLNRIPTLVSLVLVVLLSACSQLAEIIAPLPTEVKPIHIEITPLPPTETPIQQTPTQPKPRSLPATWTPVPVSSPTTRPTYTEAPTQTAGPTQTPVVRFIPGSSGSSSGSRGVSVRMYDMEVEWVGDILVIDGWIKNTGTVTIRSVWIRVTIFDGSGNQINTTTWPIDSDRLLPDTASSFSILISDPNHAVKDYKFELDSYYTD